jgi:hypothetical protein
VWSVTWVREEAQQRGQCRLDWLPAQSPLGQAESRGVDWAASLHPAHSLAHTSAHLQERTLPLSIQAGHSVGPEAGILVGF